MNGQQNTILIIEDSINLADSIDDLLKIKGYKTLKTTTGREGLELALAKKPDLIILDLRLPDIDGLEILRSLSKDDWGKTARVLILTASDFDNKSVPELQIEKEDIIHKIHCGIEDITKAVIRKLEES